MQPVKSPTLEEFRAYADAAPSKLRVWQYPGDTLDLLLRISHVEHAASVKGVPDPGLIPRLTRAAQDAQGFLIRWSTERQLGTTAFHHPRAGPSKRHVAWALQAVNTAMDWAPLETGLILAERGHQGFESQGRRVRFPYSSDPRYEALDRMVGRPFALAPDLAFVEEHVRMLREWSGRQRAGSFPDMSDREFHVALMMARRIREQSPREFEPSTSFGGFNLREAHAVWDVLHAWAFVSSLMTMASLHPSTALLSPTKDRAISDLASSSAVSPESVRDVVKMLTFRPGYHPDPAIAPLVSRGDRILIPPILVTTSSFERNLLRIVALENWLQGPIGDARGRMGIQRVAGLLATIPGVDARANLEVRRAGGRSAGDLDVVALDVSQHVGLILEIKWPAPPDHIIEILRVEDLLESAQDRVAHVRGQLERGEATIVGWPAEWPDFRQVQVHWMVLVKDHLPYQDKLRRHGVTATSWDLLWARCADSLPETLIRLQPDYGLPEEGVDFELVWRRMSLPPYTVEIEDLEMSPRIGDPRDLSALPATPSEG